MTVSYSGLSVAHLDYAQRAFTVSHPPQDGPWTDAPVPLRRLCRVRAVGRVDKRALVTSDQTSEEPRLPTQDLVTGLYGYKIPLALSLRHRPGRGLNVAIGTWETVIENNAASVMDQRQALVESALDGVFTFTQRERASVEEIVPTRHALLGLVTGVPTVRSPGPLDGGALDRLVTAMRGCDWSVLVLAQPVTERVVLEQRNAVIDEMRTVGSEEKALLAPSPLAQHYTDLLTAKLKSLTLGYGIGAWRTAVYLMGDNASYYRLATLWLALFGGEKSLPEPVRVLSTTTWPVADRDRMTAWGLPDTPAPGGPGRYRHPFAFQTLLNSRELAVYLTLPLQETTGFSVVEVPTFDTESPAAADEPTALPLGQVVSGGRPIDATYRLPIESLVKHTLVAGITGSGKTNTIFRLLEHTAAAGVPFLVLEPAKAEYRDLLARAPLRASLRVFTAGDERVSPLRLNPFYVPPGTSVAQHLDLLRSVFGASLGMWTPLPQVLERCLHEVYADYGWDLAGDTNGRLEHGERPGYAFPTLTDMVDKVSDVVPRLGYEDRVTSDIGAALVTRLDALRRGGKGRMLDTRESIDVGRLLSGPTIVELEQMGDDDDKAFLMALFLVRLYEHRRSEGSTAGLRHLLVIEEAHRLLATPRGKNEEQADPRGKAVETFSQLLSEVRAYGQGVVIADQVPVRLAPDVLKNTGRKIAHRTVASEDRAALAGAMAMDERQSRALTSLAPLEAATFGDGDDAPVLVRVPYRKPSEATDTQTLRARASEWLGAVGIDSRLTAEPFCRTTCADGVVCDTARALAQAPGVEQTFARLVLSALEDPDALYRLWPDVVAAVRARRPLVVEETELLRAACGHLSDRYARRRGAQRGWSFADTAEVSRLLREALLAKPADSGDGPGPAVEAFRRTYMRLARRSFPPFPDCDRICDQGEFPVCMYRFAVADEIALGRHTRDWHAAIETDLGAAGSPPPRATGQVALDAAYNVIDFPEADYPPAVRQVLGDSALRVAFCYAQQMLANDTSVMPPTARRLVDGLIRISHGDAEPVADPETMSAPVRKEES